MKTATVIKTHRVEIYGTFKSKLFAPTLMEAEKYHESIVNSAKLSAEIEEVSLEINSYDYETQLQQKENKVEVLLNIAISVAVQAITYNEAILLANDEVKQVKAVELTWEEVSVNFTD